MSARESDSSHQRQIAHLRRQAEAPPRNVVRWLGALAALFILSLAGASIWMDVKARQVMEQQELERVRARAETLASLVGRELEHAQTVLISVEERNLFRAAWRLRDLKALARHLEDILALDKSLLFASVYELDGTLKAIAPPDRIVGWNFAYRDWYRGVTRRKQPYISEVYSTAAGANPLVVAVVVPIQGLAGEPIGLLMAAYTLETLTEKLRSLHLGDGAYVADQRGVVAAATDLASLGKSLPASLETPTRASMGGEAGSTRVPGAGDDWLVGYAPVSELGWVVVYPRRVAESVRPAILLRQFGVLAAGFLSLIYLVTTGMALGLVRKQGALLTVNQSLNKSLQEFQQKLESLVHARTRELEQANRALRESEQHYRLLFEGNPHPMWVYDRETLGFLAVNEAAVRHYGFSREEFRNLTIKDIRPPEDVPPLQAHLDAPPTAPGLTSEWRHRKRDGTVIHVEITSREVAWQGRAARIVLAVDVTDRRSLEKQLQQAQKMEAVGHLAGGVAHDFNNLLGVILGYSELLLGNTTVHGPAQHQLLEIKKAGERAANLTRQLLAFSRKQIIEPVVLDLNSLVADMTKLLRRLIGEDIELITVLVPHLGQVKADPGQIEQVVMNLAVNARDAMPRGGKLTIETANVELDEEYARKHITVQPGSYVLLAVSDTGFGMDEATQTRMFEPFFTTKEAGKGTGLGLATVYGIVKQSGGNIWAYSEVGCGTTFKIYLPRVSMPVSAPRPAEGALAPGGNETILVVEDAEAMRKMSCEFLSSRGYTVLEAQDGQEALALAEKHPGPIHMLITDLVMPGMNGRELAQHLCDHNAQLRVLYVSGYTGDAVVRLGILEGAAAFLQKPFTLHGLAAKVREILDGQ
jgi:PAS domain S-box-containing protein